MNGYHQKKDGVWIGACHYKFGIAVEMEEEKMIYICPALRALKLSAILKLEGRFLILSCYVLHPPLPLLQNQSSYYLSV
ncbi:MAG: hypothetical protein HDR01_02435 [Lachnospiraceae bacterium]|nr:hypothetical protein [Lachnospiraceae bacterium]